jgi:hypothetical protein
MAVESEKISDSLQLPEDAPSRADSWGLDGGLRAQLKKKPGEDEDSSSEQARDACPEMVTLIALFLFCRAMGLAIILGESLFHPHAEWASHNGFQLFFFLSDGGTHVSWMTYVTIAYVMVIGVALLSRATWARTMLMATSVLSILRIAVFMDMAAIISPVMPPAWVADADFFRAACYALVGLNATLVLILLYAPGMSVWFRKKPKLPKNPLHPDSPGPVLPRI